MVVLIHTSKTMRSQPPADRPNTVPALLDRAVELHAYLSTLTPRRLARLDLNLAVRAPMEPASITFSPANSSPTSGLSLPSRLSMRCAGALS